MRLYHRTTASRGKQILTSGFRDHRGHYLTEQYHVGVWFSDVPLGMNEAASSGADGDVLLEARIPIARIRDYEWIEEGKSYREFFLPEKVANEYGRPRVVPRTRDWRRDARRRRR
ncbi:MAG TPA: hypothetical protein VKZ50_05090 [bacterium]|nr:hypothetical protein [bacterium]